MRHLRANDTSRANSVSLWHDADNDQIADADILEYGKTNAREKGLEFFAAGTQIRVV